MFKRQKLIQQLRHALSLATSPDEMIIEFDIMETTFEVDLLQTVLTFEGGEGENISRKSQSHKKK